MKKLIFILLLICTVIASSDANKNTKSITSKIANILQWEEKFRFSGAGPQLLLGIISEVYHTTASPII